jgi:hypothetical protein
MSASTPASPNGPPDRENLLRTTLAMSVDERIRWLEDIIAIALESGALPKRPDQERPAPSPRSLPTNR